MYIKIIIYISILPNIMELNFDLITRNLQEIIIDKNIALKIMAKRPIKIYWGTAPTGRIHLGYFVPILKLIDFLNAGAEVTSEDQAKLDLSALYTG